MESKSHDVQETRKAYMRSLRPAHAPAHARRTAARNAAFLLPHLHPGMRLLDAGCGPGSITIGLAETIAPGEAVGIDASTESINAARALAADRAVTNVRFDVEDVYALPFEDASFDAAFCHRCFSISPSRSPRCASCGACCARAALSASPTRITTAS